jgi:hypothetical protein
MALNRTLEWDAAKNRVVHDEPANQLLEYRYRDPWRHPKPEEI